MDPVSILAKERGRAPADLPRSGRFLDVVLLDVVCTPRTPISIGLHVDVFTITRKANRDGSLSEEYEAERAGITGRIAGIRAFELGVTEFILRNENIRSTTEYAYLTVQHLPGVTVRIGPLDTISRVLRLPFLPHTRHVPLLAGRRIALRGRTADPERSYGASGPGSEEDETSSEDGE